jgi:tungstate transport system ATP-binding protein
MAFIEAINLGKRVDGRDILKDINLSIERGEVIAFIGPTGAGKTTLLRLIGLLDVPTTGKVYIDGTDTAASARVRLELRRRMSFVLQKPVVFTASVYENIAYGLRWRGFSGDRLREKVNRALEMVGMTAYRARNARTLSGGEAQRIAIARAVALEPEVLLLDEPTANLDPVSAAHVERLILGIIQQGKTTVILSTHDRTQGQRLAGRIGVLMNGELVQVGGPWDVFSAPRNQEVAAFVGVENMIDGTVLASRDGMVTIAAGGKTIEAIGAYAIGDSVCACVRPENITISLSKAPSSARNAFEGTISRVVVSGPLARVELDCGFPLVALVTKQSAEEMGLDKEKKVYASFKATGVHILTRN